MTIGIAAARGQSDPRPPQYTDTRFPCAEGRKDALAAADKSLKAGETVKLLCVLRTGDNGKRIRLAWDIVKVGG